MSKSGKYVSHQPNADGVIEWSEQEHQVWHDLSVRQLDVIQGRACDEFMHGMKLLDLPLDRIPQLDEISAVLQQHTGWQVAQVPALINFSEFFNLLANKRFPVATFIRSREDFDYLQEPDVFHEIFGHCPLLTNPAFAHFTHTYGKLGLAANKEQRVYLARLYWFTVEFGLLNTADGLRIFGGGILSSPGETVYALENTEAQRKPLVPLDVLRTPYRIDIMQPLYYVMEKFDDLYDLADMDMMALVREAQSLGLFEPLFPPKEKLAS